MILTNKQKKFLKNMAHSLKPVIIIGGSGLTDGVLNETNSVLETHELIKVRINADTKEDRIAMIETLTNQSESNLVQSIGHVAVLYRPRKKNILIDLPKN